MRYRKTCFRIEVSGVVQGVGFRPFVYRLAQELGLAGYVLNHDSGVTIALECAGEMLRTFLDELVVRAPVAARIDSIQHEEVPLTGFDGFEIRKSAESAEGFSSHAREGAISPDLTLCGECRAEIHDPGNRRYSYPFTNCTNCGPRYTIIRSIPYDRVATTMEHFRMCRDCEAEYSDPENRRFHAQPNACASCGPALELLDAMGSSIKIPVHFNRNKPVIERAVALLRQGKILALQGVGGFHLACDAANESAVQMLRSRKARESKPFAIMFPELEAARSYVELSDAEVDFMTSAASPIVLTKRKLAGPLLASGVAPGQPRLGVFLPYSPLHELLLSSFGKPLVMTSGNTSDEPVEFNEAALERLKGLADAFLVHDRPIHVRCDDSVVQEFRGKPYFIRRSRGYAPLAIRASEPFSGDVLAVGAGLKNTVCLCKKGTSGAILSPHIGDLDSPSAMKFLEGTVAHLTSVLGIRPAFVAHDFHPDLPSTRWALKEARERGARAIAVQHHHAHIASCLERGGGKTVEGPVIGLAMDGTGLGPDGTVWGGEILIADKRDFLRAGSLRPVRIPGGEFAIKQPWRIALAYMLQSEVGEDLVRSSLKDVPDEHLTLVSQAVGKNLNSFTTSSCGRLFDAVSAIAGLCREARFEGEAAILLEAALGTDWLNSGSDCYEFSVVETGGELEIDWRPVIRALVADVRSGVETPEVSLRFHSGLVHSVISAVERISRKYSIRVIALSGGCFLNTFLRERLSADLEKRGFEVLLPTEVPCNDGGISFGQAIVANQIVKGAKSCVWQYR